MGYVADTVQRAQELAPQAKGAMNGIAVASGFAVWGQYVPMWVGIFTCVWLAAQFFMSLPRILETWKWLKNKFKKD